MSEIANTDTLRTFDLDATLPPLPVPALQDTCERYLTSVEPLLGDAARAEVKTALDELQAPGGTGEKLQGLLEERARGRGNWLSGWWEEFAYLGYPDPIVINSSIGISTDARYAPGNQAMRAAQLTAGALAFYLSIINETMPPEIQRDGSGFDMSLLKRFFATNRFPGVHKDRIATYDAATSRHIIVVRRGRFYMFEVIDDDGNALSPADLLVQFQRVIAAADAHEHTSPPVGVLTATERPAWARQRDLMALDPVNRGSLDRIDRALFLVCLDTESHEGFDALARAGLHGSAGNRWHDKSFHLVIDADGRFTLHGEHSPVDAGAWVPLIEAIGGPGEPIPAPTGSAAPQPVELGWRLSDDDIAAIETAKAVYDGLVANLDLHVRHFDSFGKDLIKTFKTGPDPMLQMAFMLAYWREQGRLPKTYEAASTRMYQGGRTETIRTASNEALAFVKAMSDPAASSAVRADTLRAAFAEHSKRGKEASAGFAVDRHLFGLKIIAMENGITDLPALFGLEIHNRGWELSTAQLPMKVGFVNHFGPVCHSGYGIGYIIKNDHINLNITCNKDCAETHATRFADQIVTALQDMRVVLEQAQAAAA